VTHILNSVSFIVTERTYLLLSYKSVDVIETDKNMKVKLKSW